MIMYDKNRKNLETGAVFFKEGVTKIGGEGLPKNTLAQNYTIDKSFNKAQNLISHPFGDGFPFF